jgi:hypothetical protein
MPVATIEVTLYEIACVNMFRFRLPVGVGGRPNGGFEGNEGDELD